MVDFIKVNGRLVKVNAAPYELDKSVPENKDKYVYGYPKKGYVQAMKKWDSMSEDKRRKILEETGGDPGNAPDRAEHLGGSEADTVFEYIIRKGL